MVDSLERQRHDHDVERIILEIVETLIDVVLQDRYAALKTSQHALIRDLDTESIGTASNQFVQQRAIAAAKVQHPSAGGHERRDDVMIGAHQTVSANAWSR